MLQIMNVKELNEPNTFEMAMRLISLDRKAYIEKILREDNKKLALAASLILKNSFYLENIAYKYYDIKISEKGKPYLEDNSFYFSISHSGELALSGHSKKPIGVDIEKIRDKIPKKTDRIFSKEEKDVFLGLKKEEQKEFFISVWSIKESISKLFGLGLSMDFTKFSVADCNNIKKYVIIDERELFLYIYKKENYIITACSEDREFDFTVNEILFDDLMFV